MPRSDRRRELIMLTFAAAPYGSGVDSTEALEDVHAARSRYPRSDKPAYSRRLGAPPVGLSAPGLDRPHVDNGVDNDG